MKGTDKQIKWAEDIKAQAIATCVGNIERMEKAIDNQTGRTVFPDEIEGYKVELAILQAFFAKFDDAAVIINKRNSIHPAQVNNAAFMFAQQIKAGVTPKQIAADNGVEY